MIPKNAPGRRNIARWFSRGCARATWAFAGLVSVLSAAAPATASPDAIDELAFALERFRGIGQPGVECYRVPIRLPEDEASSKVQLEEVWRSPAQLVVRGRDASSPGAIVRSMALYLEPLYVARTAVVDLDWGSMGESVRRVAEVHSGTEANRRTITLDFPEASATSLPAALRDVDRLSAALDPRGRLARLEVLLREDAGTITVQCDYDRRPGATQPIEARWTLPSGENVVVRTKFRREQSVLVPSVRQITFPSRFDPKETEEILVEYGAYELNGSVPDSLWSAKGSFRYDANGLVTGP